MCRAAHVRTCCAPLACTRRSACSISAKAGADATLALSSSAVTPSCQCAHAHAHAHARHTRGCCVLSAASAHRAAAEQYAHNFHVRARQRGVLGARGRHAAQAAGAAATARAAQGDCGRGMQASSGRGTAAAACYVNTSASLPSMRSMSCVQRPRYSPRESALISARRPGRSWSNTHVSEFSLISDQSKSCARHVSLSAGCHKTTRVAIVFGA